MLENKMLSTDAIFKSEFFTLDNWCLYIKTSEKGNKQILSVTPKLKTAERIELLGKLARCLNGQYTFPEEIVWAFAPYSSITMNGMKVFTVYKAGLNQLTAPVVSRILDILNQKA